MPKAAGAERDPLSAAQMIASEHLNVPEWGKYYDRMQVSVSDTIKKCVFLSIAGRI